MDDLNKIIEMKKRPDGSHSQAPERPRLPRVPTVPSTGRDVLAQALRSAGVTQGGLIRQLSDIAATGEKVTTIEKKGVVVERRITRDPQIQMKAIAHLQELLERSAGLTIERASYEKKSYG